MTIKMKQNNLNTLLKRIILLFTFFFGMFSCAIRPYQKEGEVLYLGIKELEIKEASNSIIKTPSEILNLVEEQLSYSPNNAIFGSSYRRWHLPLFAPYIYLKYKNDSSFWGRTLHRLGSKPIYIKQVNPKTRSKMTERLLAENGYFDAKVSYKILPYSKQRAKISYQVDLGRPYTYDSVEYLPKQSLDSSYVWRQETKTLLRKGDLFQLQKLQAEQEQVTKDFREHGLYYFTPSYIHYEADSLNRSGYIWLRTKLLNNLPKKALRPCYIRKVNVRMTEGDEFMQLWARNRELIDKNLTLFYDKSFPVKYQVLNRCVKVRPDSLYRRSKEFETLKAINKLGAFTGLELNYTPVGELDSLGRELLDLNILMQTDKVWDTTLETLFKFKSNDFIGPGASIGLDRRNAFGAGETLSARLYGSYEWQTGSTPTSDYKLSINSFKFGVEFGLTLPKLLFIESLFPTYLGDKSTVFKLSGEKVQRSGYYTLNNLGVSMNYLFKMTNKHRHNLTPLSIHYNQLSRISSGFDRVLRENPSLALSFQNILIPQMSYSYTWEEKFGYNNRHKFFNHLSLSEAGNLTNTIYSWVDKSSSANETKKLFKTPFAQFVKASTEFHYTYMIDHKRSLATRLSLGAIYSYGNMNVAPYSEQFYVGGANSIRAYTVRSIGPGSFHNEKETAYSFMDHVGEAKLEANIEYRTKFVGDLELATFLDAGNIWLLRQDKQRKGGSLSEITSAKDFLNQIAVGTGVGLRYDLSYLVLRFDVGIGLHLPYQTSRRAWYNIPKFCDALGLHLSIGYPF